MGYLRFLITITYVVIMLTVSLPFLLVDYIVGLFSMQARDKFTMFIVHTAFKPILFFAGVKLHITGFDKIPKDQNILYIGNHRSFFDVITTYALFPRITCFIAKKEFRKVPVLSWWMLLLHNLFLDRKDVKQGLKVILTAIDYVKNGIDVVIFPEGTRNKTQEDMLEFHEGSFKIADKSGCPIIPITMYNMSAIFEDHFPKVFSQHVFIDFGDPIYPNELSKEDRKHLGEYTRNIMLNTYQELKAEYNEKFESQKH